MSGQVEGIPAHRHTGIDSPQVYVYIVYVVIGSVLGAHIEEASSDVRNVDSTVGSSRVYTNEGLARA